MSNFTSLTSAVLREAADVQHQIEQLTRRLGDVLGGSSAPPTPPTATPAPSQSTSTGPRKRSPEAIEKMRAAQRARWGTQKDPGPTRDSIPSTIGSTGGKGKRTMSPEAKERIAAAQRARWAAQKKAGDFPPVREEMIKQPKNGGLTPEGRARLSAAMKARWTQRKKGAPAVNAKST